MKKVLILTYYWPPTGGSGVQRWVKFVKHLRSFGWEPVIYTPEKPFVQEHDESLLQEIPEGVQVLKQPVFEITRYFGSPSSPANHVSEPTLFTRFKRTIGNYIRGNFFIPDPRILWVKPSVKFLSDYLNENKVDVIVTSGPPHSLHLIGLELKTRLNIPWVPDFRDPWLEILNFHGFTVSAATLQKHELLLKKILSTADAVISAHTTVRNNFQKLTAKPVSLITNGYDKNDFESLPAADSDSSKFKLVFVGILYDKLNCTIFWEVLKEAVSENRSLSEKLEIIFVGKVQSQAMQDLERYNLLAYCQFTGYVNHDTAVGYEKAADVLLLFTPAKPEFKYVIPGKIFEYLAVQKSVICLADKENDTAQIVAETNAGVVVHPESKLEIKSVLLKMFSEYEGKTLKVNSSGFEKYERKNLTAELVKILNSVVNP